MSEKMGVVETFLSIEGEGVRTGTPVFFVRFAECNLNCGYCDTKYSHKESDAVEWLTSGQLVSRIQDAKCDKVTFTGGEPLLRYSSWIEWFIRSTEYEVNIETNGSIELNSDSSIFEVNSIITMDYKCPSSGMEDSMNMDNLEKLRSTDVLKFVVGDRRDLNRVLEIVTDYDIKSQIYVSPVFGTMDLQDLAKFVIENRSLEIKLGLQIHKFIWNPEARGV